MNHIDPRRLLVQITEILDQLSIQYFITGGIAVLIWGRPRFTADIDIVVALREKDIDYLAAALQELGEAGYIDKGAMKDALSLQGEFNFIDGNTGMKVDFWIAKEDLFAESCFRRKVSQKVLGKKVYFLSAENLILSKLRWYQMSESTRQLEDVESILKISGKKLDYPYLKKWSKKIGVFNILQKLLKKM